MHISLYLLTFLTECPTNGGSRFKAGSQRLLKNEISLHIYLKITNNISTGKHFLGNHINAIKCKNKNKNNVKSRLHIYEQCVQNIVSLVEEWKCNPFDPKVQNPQPLQTGGYASEELAKDFELA